MRQTSVGYLILRHDKTPQVLELDEKMRSCQALADITEDEKEYLIKAELPELKREDVKVTVENGVLTISGERKFEKEEKKKKYHRVERGYGSFVRSFSLPDDADANMVKAEFKNGVLMVHLPKNEKAKPKQIICRYRIRQSCQMPIEQSLM